jgi:hypothetical protein
VALDENLAIDVRAAVADHLGRAVTRAEVTAARRAAHSLALLGRARVLHVPGANAGDRNYLVLAKLNVIMNDIPRAAHSHDLSLSFVAGHRTTLRPTTSRMSVPHLPQVGKAAAREGHNERTFNVSCSVRWVGLAGGTRRIGTDMSAIFPTAHRAGLRAERDHLQERLGDPTLGMPIESNLPGGGLRFSFQGDGYVVRHDFKPQAGGLLNVQLTKAYDSGSWAF